MKFQNRLWVLMIPLVCAASSDRALAQAAVTPCEEAITRKVKAEKKPEKVAFASDARSVIPHGPLTHHAGQGSYETRDGGRTHFEWFCDLDGASGKPTNLHYAVLTTDAPVATAPAPVSDPAPATKAASPKSEVVVSNETWTSACKNAVVSEVKKKNPAAVEIDFHSAKGSAVSDSDNLLEGDGSFKSAGKSTGKNDQDREVTFNYRCIYDEKSGKTSAKFFLKD